jgi:hypothetical protein
MPGHMETAGQQLSVTKLMGAGNWRLTGAAL